MSEASHHNVVIIGGGTAGITVAASLEKRQGGKNLSIAIVEPCETHYYQPAFTLVGAGVSSLDSTRRPLAQLIPTGVSWIKDKAAVFDPANNRVELAGGGSVNYDYLIVCPGLCLDWSKIDGAEQALGSNGVCSNYDPRHAQYSWQCLQSLKPGAKALFTQAPLPFKCPGAPQKWLTSPPVT